METSLTNVNTSSVQSLSCVRLFLTPWNEVRQASLSITNSQILLKLMSIELVMPSNDLILYCPLLPTLNYSQHQGLFKWVSSSHQVAKVLEFQLQHQSFQLICRADFFLDGLVGSPCSPRDSQESSPTPQFKSIYIRVGCFERTASKHVYYQGWNRSPAQVRCMRQVLGAGPLGRPRGMGWGGRWEGGLGWEIHVNPWLIHVNVWQKPLQYCKVISLQLINEKIK